jgi:ribose transport system permease protein
VTESTVADAPAGVAGGGPGRGRAAGDSLRRVGILIPFIALFVVLSLTSGPFLTKDNLLLIVDQQSGILIVAAAGTLVLIAGGIDLSVGATYSLGAVISAHFAAKGMTPGFAIVLGVGGGLLVGAVNGLLVTVARINALIATLAMAFVVGGIASLVTKGNLIVLQDRPNFAKFATTNILGVKSSTWIMLIAVVAIGVLLARTVRGRYMYATGGNADAARLAGVPVDRVRVLTFVLSGAAAGLAGVLDSSRVLSAQATNGDATLAFTVLAGIVVGGTSILGGEGAVWRSVVGILFIALIQNGYILLGLDPLYEEITLGVLLILAVALDAWARGAYRRA